MATYPSLSTQAEEMRLYWQPVSTRAFTSFPAHCGEWTWPDVQQSQISKREWRFQEQAADTVWKAGLESILTIMGWQYPIFTYCWVSFEGLFFLMNLELTEDPKGHSIYLGASVCMCVCMTYCFANLTKALILLPINMHIHTKYCIRFLFFRDCPP